MTHFDDNPHKHYHPHSQKYKDWETAYRQGQTDCAGTHFKPDWKIGARAIAGGETETRETTLKAAAELLKKYDTYSQYSGRDRDHPVRRLDIPNDVIEAIYKGIWPDPDGR